MKFWCRHWYNIGGVVAVLALAYLIGFWADLSVLVRVQLMSFIAMLVHQFEEYAWLGGEPAIMNLVLQESPLPLADRFPLNQFSAMVINVMAAYGFYLLPVFFPNVIWLGLMPMLIGFMQFVVHGIVTPKKLGQFYNPGMFAVLALHYPVGIYYLYYVYANGLISGWDWIFALVYMAIVMVVFWQYLTYKVLADKDTSYVFTAEEMAKWNVQERLEKFKNRVK